ncbi:MAG: 2OG-Fe(II) oxygenase family protein [Gammaproteobacteria bacterium]|nr:2OG-Fe(II) oxygenase family protein [Gammaproteobacteria bacterium]
MTLDRREFFKTPIFSVTLPQLLPMQSEYIADVMRMVDSGETLDSDRYEGLQTEATLFERQESHWRMLHDAFVKLCEAIEKDERERGGQLRREFKFVRAACWAYIQTADTGKTDFHTHLPNRWSAVYYLKIPSDMPDLEGGTAFDDPRQPVTNDEVVVKFGEGEMCIFPSWLRHAPVPSPSTHETRITLAMDALYLPAQ